MDLDLTVRSTNCLESAAVTKVAQLVVLTERELLKFRSFGRTSLREIKRKLEDVNLTLGMQLPPGVDGSIDIPADALEDGETLDGDDFGDDAEFVDVIDDLGDEVIGTSEENE